MLQAAFVWIVIGLVAGWLASLFLGGKGIVRYIIVGLLGAIVGGFLFSATGINFPVDNFWIREILVAAIGAVVVIIVSRIVAR